MINIPSNSQISKEIKDLKEEMYLEFENEVEMLKDELVVMTPVQTGFLRDSWNNVEKIGPGKYVLVNTANYSEIVLIRGLKNGQLPQGVLPHVRQWKDKFK